MIIALMVYLFNGIFIFEMTNLIVLEKIVDIVLC